METQSGNRPAIIGLVGTIPSLIIVSGGFWQLTFGVPNIWESLLHLTPQSLIIHPVLVLGGLLLAIGLNAVPLFRVQFQPEQNALSTTVTLHWKLSNLAVLTLSLFLLCAILGYAFVENFRIVPR